MKMIRRIRRSPLASALAGRMLLVKRSVPRDSDLEAADLAVSSSPVGVGLRPGALDLLHGYYVRHGKVLCSIAGGLLLATLAGWAKHRKLI